MAVSVKSYGAVGDGSADDTAKIQAADAAARSQGADLYFPAGTYRCGSTVTYGAAGSQSYHRWFGDGPLRSKLVWGGASSGYPLCRVEGMILGGIHGIGFSYPSGADGTGLHYGSTIGLWLANSTGSGSGQNGNRFSDLFFEGFNQGLLVGDVANTRAASELLFHNVRLQYCNVGVQCSDSNTLDIDFHMLQTALCTTGLDVGACGNLHVYGGSSTANGIDFSFGTGGTFSLNGYRSESVTKHNVFVYGTNVLAPTKVAVRNCNFQAVKTGGGDYGTGTGGTGGGCSLWLFGGAEVMLDQCHIEGWVGAANYYSRPRLTMQNTTVRPLSGQTGPFAFYYGTDASQYGDRYLDNMRYDVRGCSKMAADTPFWVADGSSHPDASSFFTDASGVCPATNSRAPPATWS